MIGEFFKALFLAGLPVAVTSYLLAWWALKNGYFGQVDNLHGLESEVKRLTSRKSRKERKRRKKSGSAEPEPVRHKMNPVHNKWLSFGGGFYGVVALMTYAVIELGEIRDFIVNLGGFFQVLANISLDLVIGFIINSFMNFIWATAWPAYWMSEAAINDIWIWFLMAYGGYWAGTRYALHRAGPEPT